MYRGLHEESTFYDFCLELLVRYSVTRCTLLHRRALLRLLVNTDSYLPYA